MADVSYEIDSNGIAVVTWDLEDRSMNVLNLRSIAEYKKIIEKCISIASIFIILVLFESRLHSASF